MRLPIDAAVVVPGSKSHANRAIVCAALAQGTTEIRGATPCDDVSVMVEGLRSLGFRVQWTDAECGMLTVHGGLPQGGGKATLDLHNAGTAIRFLTSVAALVPGTWTLTGDKHMQKRPIGDLLTALRSLGASITDQRGSPPVTVGGGMLRGNEVSLKADISSQYLSSLLMIAPLLPDGLRIKIDGKLASEGYVDLTRKTMADFGLHVKKEENTFFVQKRGYTVRKSYDIEGDWSAAGAWLVLAALTGSTIRMPNLRQNSEQSDRKLPEVIKRLQKSGDVTMDASDIPDQVMNLAVFGAFRRGSLRITGVKNLRHKECDRLRVITTELKKAGVRISEHPDGITVKGGPLTTAPVTLDPHDDHRMAMCFTILGLLRGNVTIKNPDCVQKSYPSFFRDLERLLLSHRPLSVVGMRGAGKSSLGRRLASRLGSEHLDSDHLFQDAYGPIKEFIAKRGWQEFRRLEEETVASAIRPGIVLSLGGGSLGSAKTRKLIKDKTTAVWLQAKESELIKRLQSGKRPPLTDLPLHEEVRKFLLERGPHYREVAKVAVSPPVPFGKQVPSVLSDLKKLLRSR